jgi:AP-2 complex subunit alpha
MQGVVVCVTSLVMALAQDHLDSYAVCYTKAVDRMYRVSMSSVMTNHLLTNSQLVVEHQYSANYAYYKVPSPWLQVKLLRLLQYYPPSGLECAVQSVDMDTIDKFSR